MTVASDFTDNRDQPEKVQPKKPSILLHSCCGPCSTAVMERLADRYRVTLYFYNPNITDREEYEKRREAQKTAIEKFNGTRPEDSRIRLVEGPYDPTVFFEAVKGYEQEPENGSRCDPVSYTHLDVYKRQIVLYCGPVR